MRARVIEQDGRRLEMLSADGRKLVLKGVGADTLGLIGPSAGPRGTTEAKMGFAHYLGLNDFFAADPKTQTAIQGFRLAEHIAENPKRIAVHGVQGMPPKIVSGDNRIARSLREALHTPIDFPARSGRSAQEVTLRNYAAGIVEDYAHRAQTNDEAIEWSDNLENVLSQRIESLSGVQTDEELSQLITYQNLYVHSARALAIGIESFDIFLNSIR